MSSFVTFVGDFTSFGNKPKTTADSDDTREALVWFFVERPMILAVTPRMFSKEMKNLDPFIFADVDVDPNAIADVDTEADSNSNAYVDFELNILEVISVFLNFDFFLREEMIGKDFLTKRVDL